MIFAEYDIHIFMFQLESSVDFDIFIQLNMFNLILNITYLRYEYFIKFKNQNFRCVSPKGTLQIKLKFRFMY